MQVSWRSLHTSLNLKMKFFFKTRMNSLTKRTFPLLWSAPIPADIKLLPRDTNLVTSEIVTPSMTILNC